MIDWVGFGVVYVLDPLGGPPESFSKQAERVFLLLAFLPVLENVVDSLGVFSVQIVEVDAVPVAYLVDLVLLVGRIALLHQVVACLCMGSRVHSCTSMYRNCLDLRRDLV